MASQKVSIDEMASAVNQMMAEYVNLTREGMQSAVRKTATSVRKDIQSGAPVRTGAYKKDWATKKTEETSNKLVITVYNKRHYQLAHLLENGHANRGGGRTKAYPHIAPAEEAGEKQLEKLIEKALKG